MLIYRIISQLCSKNTSNLTTYIGHKNLFSNELCNRTKYLIFTSDNSIQQNLDYGLYTTYLKPASNTWDHMTLYWIT